MNKFDVKQLVETIQHIEIQHNYCYLIRQDGNGNKIPPDEQYSNIVKIVRTALQLCESSVGLQDDATERIRSSLMVMTEMSTRLDASSLEAELRHIHEAIVWDILKLSFLVVREERAGCVDKDDLFGDAVNIAFPSARADIREASNCLAADCNTAAVFHLMRAVEWGLRALCVQLGFRRLRTINKKTKRVTYKLIEYTEWETILNQLQDRVDRKLARVRRGPQKQLYQEFYYPVLQDIRGIRDAWRNHVMHTRREYTYKEADAILDHVFRLMVTLASRITEV